MPNHSTDLICLSRSDFFETHEESQISKLTPEGLLTEEELGLIGKSSVSKSIFNVLCALVGGGVLGLSYALRLSGWYGLIMLVMMGFMAMYTAILIGRCISYDATMKSYADIGMKAFHKPGKIVVFVMQVLSCLGCAIIYLIIAGENMKSMMSAIPNTAAILSNQKFWSAIAIVVVLPLCYMKSLETFAFMALIGMLLSVIAIVCIIAAIATVNPADVNHNYGNVTFSSFLSGFAIMAFSYAAHPVFPDVQRVMKHPEHFGRVSYISFGTCIVLYILTATLGYYTFGEKTNSSILLNFNNSIPALIAKICITSHVLFGYVVYLHPIFFAIERHIGAARKNKEKSKELSSSTILSTIEPPLYNDLDAITEVNNITVTEIAIGNKPPSIKPAKVSRKLGFPALRILLRTLVVAFSLAVAVLLPFFSDLMGFIGGSTLSATFLILPCLFHLKLYWPKIPLWEKVLNFAIVVFGVFAGAVACVTAVINIIKKIPYWSFQ
jgi:amino acid permease